MGGLVARHRLSESYLFYASIARTFSPILLGRSFHKASQALPNQIGLGSSPHGDDEVVEGNSHMGWLLWTTLVVRGELRAKIMFAHLTSLTDSGGCREEFPTTSTLLPRWSLSASAHEIAPCSL